MRVLEQQEEWTKIRMKRQTEVRPTEAVIHVKGFQLNTKSKERH